MELPPCRDDAIVQNPIRMRSLVPLDSRYFLAHQPTKIDVAQFTVIRTPSKTTSRWSKLMFSSWHTESCHQFLNVIFDVVELCESVENFKSRVDAAPGVLLPQKAAEDVSMSDVRSFKVHLLKGIGELLRGHSVS